VLAGSLEALEQHCQLIRDHPKLQGSDIDFKLSEDSHEQHDQRATEETGFDHLTVRQCKVGTIRRTQGGMITAMSQTLFRTVTP
jgi:hypothetical protein